LYSVCGPIAFCGKGFIVVALHNSCCTFAICGEGLIILPSPVAILGKGFVVALFGKGLVVILLGKCGLLGVLPVLTLGNVWAIVGILAVVAFGNIHAIFSILPILNLGIFPQLVVGGMIWLLVHPESDTKID
jgi:hypothetical protein